MPVTYSFHRLSPAPYFVSLMAGEYDLLPHYNYINDPEHNGGIGQAAAADDAKLYGPNQGSYYVAFGEDAIGLYVNRPAQALAFNTDFLDNLMHQDLALPSVYVAMSTGTDQITIPEPISGAGGVFLGGTPTSPADDFTDLFHICDAEDEDLTLVYLPTGAPLPIVVIAAHDNGTHSPVSPYFSGGSVTLTFNASIPVGTVVRIYYGMRSNLASLPPDALTYTNIRTLTNLSYQTEDIFAELQGPEVLGIPWDGPGGMASPSFLSTIWDLSMSGLNERYNRSTAADSASPPVIDPPEDYWPTTGVDYGPLNTAGAGGWINRTGPALTVYSGNTHQDPFGALFSAKSWDTSASGGVVGFVAYGTRLSGINTAESSTGRIPGTALFAGLWPHDTETGLPSANFLTRIPAGTVAVLACPGSNNPATITLSVGFFYNAFHQSAIAVGYDLLEVTYASGKVETFVIVYLSAGNDRVARLRYPDGTVPTSAPDQNVTVRWVSTSFAVGDGAGPYHSTKYADTNPVLLDGLYYQVPPVLTSIPSSYDTVPRLPAMFSAQGTDYDSPALMWGGFNNLAPSSGPYLPSMLTGDGGMSVWAPSLFNDMVIITAGENSTTALVVQPCPTPLFFTSNAASFRGGDGVPGFDPILPVNGGRGVLAYGGAGLHGGSDGISIFGYGGGITNGVGVAGLASGGGIGLVGGSGFDEADLLAAIYAQTSIAVAGFADTGTGIYGYSAVGVGIHGVSNSNREGVHGEGGSSLSSAGPGGVFEGGTPLVAGDGGIGVWSFGGAAGPGGDYDGVGLVGHSQGTTNGIGSMGIAAGSAGIGAVGAGTGWTVSPLMTYVLTTVTSLTAGVGLVGVGPSSGDGVGILALAKGLRPALHAKGDLSWTSTPVNDGLGIFAEGSSVNGSGILGLGYGAGVGVQGFGPGASIFTLEPSGRGAGGYFQAGTGGPGLYCIGTSTNYALHAVGFAGGAAYIEGTTHITGGLTVDGNIEATSSIISCQNLEVSECVYTGSVSAVFGTISPAVLTFDDNITVTSGQLILGASGLSCTSGTVGAETIAAGSGGLTSTGGASITIGNITVSSTGGYIEVSDGYVNAVEYVSTSGYMRSSRLGNGLEHGATGVGGALYQDNTAGVVGMVNSIGSGHGFGFTFDPVTGWDAIDNKFTVTTDFQYADGNAIVQVTGYTYDSGATWNPPYVVCPGFGYFSDNNTLVLQMSPSTGGVLVTASFSVYGTQS